MGRGGRGGSLSRRWGVAKIGRKKKVDMLRFSRRTPLPAARRACSLRLRRCISSTSSLQTTIDTQSTWSKLQSEAREAIASSVKRGYGLRDLIEQRVLSHGSLADGLSATIGAKLEDGATGLDYAAMCSAAYAADASIVDAAAADLERFLAMDPAADGLLP